ncbi:MAG TPA: sigma factor-like helix-turn-helix DNA-binding protein [Myxococcaceae bacterium]|nr:sigma factor-like helix-turn-helix DNA-binding protein [Myxococcaceae bacterium]
MAVLVLVNVCRMLLRERAARRRAHGHPAFAEILAARAREEPEMESYQVTAEFFVRAMGTLSPRQRTVMELMAVGEDHRMMAYQLGISPGAVAKRLFDARGKLRRVLRWLIAQRTEAW